MGQDDYLSPLVIDSFRGLNTKLSEISLSQREATSLLNVNLTKETAEARSGSTLWTTTQLVEASTAKAVTGIYQAVLGSTVYRVITGGTKIYSVTAAGVLTDITGAVTITDSADNLFNFCQFKNNAGADIIIALNGVDAPIKWTGAGNAAALGGTPPANFKFGLVHKNRLWATSGEYLYHTDLLNAEVYDSVNWIARFPSKSISTNDITGLKVLGDTISIFKENAIFLLSGESIPESAIQEVVQGDGAISGYSIQEVFSRRYGQILVFKNRNGELKGFNGTKDLIHLSDPIDNTLRTYNTSRSKYSSGVTYKARNEYICTATSSENGTTHDSFIGYDYFLDAFSLSEDIESTMLLFSGITANYLSIMDYSGSETLFCGTYDGWVLRYDTGTTTDVVRASQIGASPTGAVRSSNVVTITTLAPHGFSVGDSVVVAVTTIATGSGSFDGTFTVASTPTSSSFTYAQTAADATGGAGIVYKPASVSAYWASKKNSFGQAAFQKQINDFNIVTNGSTPGQVKVTVTTERYQGQNTVNVTPSGSIYGQVIYGQNKYGGAGISYKRVVFNTGGVDPLIGRYFKFKIENVSGFQFGLEEFIVGATQHGYQNEYEVT